MEMPFIFIFIFIFFFRKDVIETCGTRLGLQHRPIGFYTEKASIEK
jgi:hypothetical protein